MIFILLYFLAISQWDYFSTDIQHSIGRRYGCIKSKALLIHAKYNFGIILALNAFSPFNIEPLSP